MDTGPLLDRLRWLGQSGFLLQDRRTVYIDPWNIPEGLPKADLVLITHAHYDHYSPADIERVSTPETVLAGPRECVTHHKGNQLPLQLGETRDILGVRVQVVQAYNLKKPYHHRDRAGFGYVVETMGASIYHAGDTDLTPELSAVRCDVALLPVGGIYVMDAAEAFEAAKALKPKAAVPMHFGSLAGKVSDAQRFEQCCLQAGIASRTYPLPAPAARWQPEPALEPRRG